MLIVGRWLAVYKKAVVAGYITNDDGDGALGDRLLVRFTDIIDVQEIIPFFDTY